MHTPTPPTIGQRYVQLVNLSMRRSSTRPCTAVHCLPGQPIALGGGLALALYFDRALDGDMFPLDRPALFSVIAELRHAGSRQPFLLRAGDFIDLPTRRIKLWPVAFDVERHSARVFSIALHVEHPATDQPLQRITP